MTKHTKNIREIASPIWEAYHLFDPKFTFNECVSWLAFRFQESEREIQEHLFERLPRDSREAYGFGSGIQSSKYL